MSGGRGAWEALLVASLVALGSSLGWAATRMDDGHWGMMSYGSGMMGYADPDGGEPVGDLAGARRQAERFAGRLDLRVGEAMQFSRASVRSARRAPRRRRSPRRPSAPAALGGRCAGAW
jgi:hypothetical protein